VAERVVITGLGVVSSLGSTIDEFWPALIKGTSGISQVTAFDTSGLERHYGGQIKEFSLASSQVPVKAAGLPRTHQFALSAAHSALKDSGLKDLKNSGIVLGSIVGGLELIEEGSGYGREYPVYMTTANVCRALGFGGCAFMLSCACAAGNYAIGLAYEKIKHGEQEVIIAGGADYFSISTFIGFYRLFSLAPYKCQPFDKNRRGMLPAEGAGMLVLESLSSAKKRNAPIYAEVLGYGTSVDAHHPVIPSQDGIFYCMKDTLEASGTGISDIDYINAHGTGTVPNDKTESAAIHNLFGRSLARKIPVSSIKSMLGHAMAAASALEAVSCCLTLKEGIIPPTIHYETPDPECDIDCVPNQARRQKVDVALNNSFGFGGMNCSLALGKYPSG
jgi:3-oxoacyl-[acyl-carrier-protein] synthase II